MEAEGFVNRLMKTDIGKKIFQEEAEKKNHLAIICIRLCGNGAPTSAYRGHAL